MIDAPTHRLVTAWAERLRTQARRSAHTVRAYQATAERLAAGESRWRSLFETMREGFLVGDLVRDATSRAVDARLIEMNSAFATSL